MEDPRRTRHCQRRPAILDSGDRCSRHMGILWDEQNERMLRATDPDPNWRPSEETLDQCIALGEKYEKLLRAD